MGDTSTELHVAAMEVSVITFNIMKSEAGSLVEI
jgi:hypothetical protein